MQRADSSNRGEKSRDGEEVRPNTKDGARQFLARNAHLHMQSLEARINQSSLLLLESLPESIGAVSLFQSQPLATTLRCIYF